MRHPVVGVRGGSGEVQPSRVRRQRDRQAGQGRRPGLHRVHLEAPRRVRDVADAGEQLEPARPLVLRQEPGHPRRDEGGRRCPGREVRAVLLDYRLARAGRRHPVQEGHVRPAARAGDQLPPCRALVRRAVPRLVDGDHRTPEREANIPTAPMDGAPWESCLTTGNRWGWTRYDSWKPAAQLTRNLLDIVGRDGNLLLNIGPDDHGVVPSDVASRLRQIGQWIGTAEHSSAVYGATYTGLVADPTWGAVSRKSDKLYLSVYDWPAAGTPLHLTTRDPFGIVAARVLGSTSTVTWRAAGDGFDIFPSGTATDSIATVIELTIKTQTAVTGTGTGLTARYWTNSLFTGSPAVTRIDRSLNFAWRTKGSPASTIPVDNFSARWTGWVQPQFTGPHTFLMVSDETVKVWVDGKIVIDNTTPHGPTVNKGTITLQTGHKYSIRIDFTERTGEAYLKLLWASPNRKQRIIPTSQLYPS